MKKYLALFLILTLLGALLTACVQQSAADPTPGKDAAADVTGQTDATEQPADDTPTNDTPADDAPNGDAPTGGDDTPSGGDDTPSGGNDTPSGGDDTPSGGDDIPTDAFVPTLRFVVASDVHITDSATVRDEKFAKLFTDAYAYCDAQTTYRKLDGVFVAGDISDNGSATSLARFFDALTGNVREGTVTRAVLGNHEFFTDAANTVSRFLTASGYDSADAHLVVGGYHFILLSPDKNGSGYSADKQAWLAAQLRTAMDDDPTGKKPIFVFHHHHVRGTVYGSANTWGVQDLYPVLSMCPQVVDFSGHSHFPINDPRSVWQGTFTAFNTASLKGLEMDLIGVADEKIYPTDDKGGWAARNAGRADGGQYYVVEVDAKNRLRVTAYDIMTDQAVIEPILIEEVGAPDAFTYTDARRNNETPPVFAEGATVTAVRVTAYAASFIFPRTTGETYVQNYRCEISRDGVLVSTVYRLDDGFLFPAPKTLTLSFGGLLPDTAYTVRIVPVTAWGNEGEPLCFTFATKDESTVASAEESLVFSTRFGADGSAVESVSDTAMTAKGTPATVYDEAQQKYVGVFNGQSAYAFYDVSTYHAGLLETFTFETYVRMDAMPGGRYVNHFSNMESGGFGFQYESDGSMTFYIHAGGAYQHVGVALAVGEWAHFAATYDGEILILYKNGGVVDQLAVTGPVKPPQVRFFAVGGDTSSGDTCNAFAACAVGCANVYSAPLTAAQVAALYAAYPH